MKRFLTILISFITVFLLIGFGLKGFRYLVTDDTKSYTRLMMHDLYNQEENIDYLFVGSSHCYRSVIPSVADEILGGHSFNCGSSAQRMDGSLTLVKEVVKNYQPKVIVLDVYYEMIDTVPHSEREELTSTYAIADYMPYSMNKISYLINASSSDYYINSFIVGRRYWRKLFDYEYIKQLMNAKDETRYKDFKWTTNEGDMEYYSDRGYVAFEGKNPDYEKSTETIHIETDKFTDEWKGEFNEIIKICKDRDIKLVVVAAPLPEETLACIDNYTDYVLYIREFLSDTGTVYCDFNEEALKIAELDDSCYMDGDHLNSKGAQIYTEVISKLLLKMN